VSLSDSIDTRIAIFNKYLQNIKLLFFVSCRRRSLLELFFTLPVSLKRSIVVTVARYSGKYYSDMYAESLSFLLSRSLFLSFRVSEYPFAARPAPNCQKVEENTSRNCMYKQSTATTERHSGPGSGCPQSSNQAGCSRLS